MDSWVDLSFIDRYKVKVVSAESGCDSQYKVFFLNLGGYQSKYFGERHHDIFLVAKSKAEARSMARKKIETVLDLPHVDFSYQVDECIEAPGFEGVCIEVTENDEVEERTNLVYNNGYFKLAGK